MKSFVSCTGSEMSENISNSVHEDQTLSTVHTAGFSFTFSYSTTRHEMILFITVLLNTVLSLSQDVKETCRDTT